MADAAGQDTFSEGTRLAARLLDELAVATADPPGVTRIAYGPGERFAHDLVRREAGRLGAVARTDAAGNLYLKLAGTDPTLPALVIGSHLDSVPHGGNFDGAAGVVAGLGVMAEIVRLGIAPMRDLIVMATAGPKRPCGFPFPIPAATQPWGACQRPALTAKRSDTGRSLSDHMRAEGFDPDAVSARRGRHRCAPGRRLP